MARSRSASRSRDLDLDGHGRKRRRTSQSPSPSRRRRHNDRDSPRREDRDGPRSDDVEERQSGRHRSRADDRRGGSREDYRDNRSHRDSDRRGDRPRSRELATSISARLGDKPADRSLSTKPAEAAAVTEAPRERPSLKAGPAGGAYIPPFRLQQMLREANDKTGPQYQRMTWDALRKSLNGLINKVNVKNIKEILPDIFGENLIRGRGVFCRSLMKSQLASPTFTATYAALIAIINTKFPEIGELLLKRVISQFLKAFKRNDKNMAVGCLKFIAHLCNQQVAHEALALEIMVLLLDNPTNDSVEIALEFASDVAALLEDTSPQSFTMVQSGLRTILQEGTLKPRIQMLVQNFFSAVSYGVVDPDSAKEKARLKTQEDNRKLGFPDRPVHGLPPRIPAGLDLVDAADARCHNYDLDSPLDRETGLDIFKVDPEYEQHEAEYKAIKDEILGTGESSDEEDDGEEGSEDESGSEDEEQAQQKMEIQDQTQTDLINLRRTIYLTIMSSAQFEEAGHKLMKIKLAQGQEIEVVTMLIECCSQEKTYISYYGHLSQRFCNINRTYQELFEQCVSKQYGLIHRLETNKLRNVARLFAHLLTTDAISWSVLACIRLTEEDTTSSSRIFIKILFQDLSENLGLMSLNQRLQEPTLQMFFDGIFPKDTPRNMRFSINFFTSIGLGGLTDRMREHLKNLPRLIATQPAAESDSSSSDDSSSDSSSDSASSSSDSSDSDSSDSDSSSSSSSDDSEDEAPTKKDKGKAPQHTGPLPPPPARLIDKGPLRRSMHAVDVDSRVQNLSLDKHSRGHSSRNGQYPSEYVTDGHQDPYEDPQRARQSRRGHKKDQEEYDNRGSREPAEYEDEDAQHDNGGRQSRRRDRHAYEEEDRHDENGRRSRRDRHASREEKDQCDDRGRGHRDKNGHREGTEYQGRERRSPRRERNHRYHDKLDDRQGPIPDDDRWDGRA